MCVCMYNLLFSCIYFGIGVMILQYVVVNILHFVDAGII
jgi:hypothetical protein